MPSKLTILLGLQLMCLGLMSLPLFDLHNPANPLVVILGLLGIIWSRLELNRLNKQ